MSFILLNIQKYIFHITLGTSLFLGYALAYFVSNLIPLLLDTGVPGGELVAADRNSLRISRTEMVDKESFYSIVTGNLVRDSAATLQGSGDIEEKGMGSEAPAVARPDKDITLQGVLYGAPSFARAAFLIDGESEANEYKIGDMVSAYTLVRIKRSSAVVKLGDQYLEIEVGNNASGVFAGKSESSSRGSRSGGDEVVSSGNVTKVPISRDKIIELKNNPEILYRNKFSPVTKNGKILGLRLIYVPNDNIIHDLGARSGDIIRRVNGQPLESQDKMIEFYQGLSDLEHVTIDLERAGKIVSYEVVVK